MAFKQYSRFTAFAARPLAYLPLLFAFVLCSNSAFAGDQNVFRFNISPNGYPPYMIVDQGAPSGIMWDVVSLIAKRLDYQIVAKKIPRKRVDRMLLNGDIDGTSRAKEWTHEPSQFLFTDPIVTIHEVFFTPENAEVTYNHPRELFSKTVVTHLGYLYPSLQPYFESGAIRRFDVSRDKDMFNFLLHGDRFDAAVVDLLVGKWILKNEGMQSQFRFSDSKMNSYGFRVMLNKKWQPFANKFNAELARIRENGELDAILANYR